MTRDPYRYFRIEARELLDALGRGVLDLEKGTQSAEAMTRLLRQAHTLKGAARVVRHSAIADRAHAFEDLLAPFREGTDAVPRDRIDLLLAELDGIERQVGDLSAPDAAPAPAVPAAPAPGVRTVRVDLADLDAVRAAIGDLLVLAGTLDRELADLGRAASRTGTDHDAPLARGQRRLRGGVERLQRELHQLRDRADRLRLVPAGLMFTALERTVRDLARAQGRRIVFETRGADVRVDAHVLDLVQNGLVQLVRNAVSHGIETEAARRAAGKPAEGRIAVEVARQGSRITFACRDDGRGIDMEAVKRAVAARGDRSPEGPAPDQDELIRMLLRGGITTSAEATEAAGRGVGLNVVDEAARSLGGEVRLSSSPGAGTSVEISAPLSIASSEALVVRANGSAAALPLDGVRRALRVAPRDLSPGAAGTVVHHEGRTIPFVRLRTLLGGEAAADRSGPVPAVIVESGAGAAAVAVDRITGTATLLLRPLPDMTRASGVVSGVSVDAEGNPILVLDVDDLVAAAARAPAEEARPPEPVAPRRILVVDDSLTTRMLEQSILESAGYAVDLATSGEEGLERASAGTHALFLVDVEMPGMDGFTFIERARADPGLSHVPSILVTSRSSPEDERRGREAGAQGYIVKSEFDQRVLLERIRELVGR